MQDKCDPGDVLKGVFPSRTPQPPMGHDARDWQPVSHPRAIHCFEMLDFFQVFFLLVSWRFFSIRDSHRSFPRGGTTTDFRVLKDGTSRQGYTLTLTDAILWGGYDLVGGRVWLVSHLKVIKYTLYFFPFDPHLHPLWSDIHPHCFPETDPTNFTTPCPFSTFP